MYGGNMPIAADVRTTLNSTRIPRVVLSHRKDSTHRTCAWKSNPTDAKLPLPGLHWRELGVDTITGDTFGTTPQLSPTQCSSYMHSGGNPAVQLEKCYHKQRHAVHALYSSHMMQCARLEACSVALCYGPMWQHQCTQQLAYRIHSQSSD